MRLIDADALKKEFPNDTDWEYPVNTNEYVCEKIDEQPTIEERKKGRWIIKDNPGTGWYRVTCSECGEDVTSTAPCIGFYPNAKVTWDYCPNCGCRMEGEQE